MSGKEESESVSSRTRKPNTRIDKQEALFEKFEAKKRSRSGFAGLVTRKSREFHELVSGNASFCVIDDHFKQLRVAIEKFTVCNQECLGLANSAGESFYDDYEAKNNELSIVWQECEVK